MKKSRYFALIAFVSLFSSALLGQNQTFFTGEFEKTPLDVAIGDIENKSNVKFYFANVWLDSVYVSGFYDHVPLEEVLKDLLKETHLSFFIESKKIILTSNVVIDANPKIASSFLRENNDPLSTTAKSGNNEVNNEKGLIFVREYQNKNIDETDYENFVFDIGNRNKMVIGGKSTIVGYVKDAESGQPIVGTLVYIKEPFLATTTDPDGFYSLSLPIGKHTIYYQYAGMKTTKRNIVLFSNGNLNVSMDVDIIALQEVVIESGRDENVKDVKIGVNRIDIENTKSVPLALGERDIMKIATTMAGVQTPGEGAAGYNVRGGKADQNLILMDGAPVYNSSHFFGFFSAFNADAIDNMEVYKGSIPAKFGGRLSSVFDIQGKIGNKQKFSGSGGISPVTSRINVEIPIIKDTSSLLIGTRWTYSNWVLKQIENANFKENKVAFFDVISKYHHTIDKDNTVSISAYMSKDDFRISSDTLFSFSNFSYYNLNGSVKWDHRINNQLDGSLSAIYSSYNYKILYDESPPNAFTQDFGINEVTLRADFNYFPQESQRINFGLSSKKYGVNPGTKSANGPTSTVLETKIQHEQALESALYLSDQYDITPELTVYGGVRYVMFNAFGEQDVYSYQDGLPKNGESRTDTTYYGKGELMKTYHGPEIRVYGRYAFNDQTSVKVSYNRTRQYIHTLSNSSSLSPTDTWRMSSQHLMPQIADQYSIGFYKNLLGNKLEASVEAYYKKLQNLVDFKVGANFLLHPAVETEVLQGKGKSYGLEVSLNKSGRLNGWVNYTYARTFIKLDGASLEERINNGTYYPASYDKPHTFNLVANYKATHRISFSSNVTYNTGRPVTIPAAVYDLKGAKITHYGNRNSFRIPDYFRVDLGVSLEGNHKIRKLAHAFWSFSIYNVLGIDNPYSVFFDVKEDGTVQGYKLIVFGKAIPTITYNFKF